MLYPSEELKNNVCIIENILKQEAVLGNNYILELLAFIDYIKNTNLFQLQETYVSLFDRKKNLSLYLFEHVHGDSRDRGMAMVDLKNLYKASSFDIPIGGELPDYIPVFLEYLSILSVDKAADLLSEIVNIIAIIGTRLRILKSIYYVIFLSLESLSRVKSDDNIVNKALLDKALDNNSNEFTDNNWEDSKVF